MDSMYVSQSQSSKLDVLVVAQKLLFLNLLSESPFEKKTYLEREWQSLM